MSRKVLVVLAVIALILAVVWWRRSGDAGKDSKPGASASKTVAGATSTAARPRVDPKTLTKSSLAGTVRDEAKAPIAKARVCADGNSHDIDDDLLRDSICADADERGQFVIDGLLPAKYTVSASAKAFRPDVHHPNGDRRKSPAIRLAAGERKTGVDITLRPGGVELTGTVSDITGGPIGNAKVWASGNRWSNDGAHVTTETDATGKFTLWVNPGSVSLTAAADGYTDERAWETAPGKVDILLTPESTLAGTVVDAASGAPVAGARVSIGWDQTKFTDDKGAFRFSRLSPERHVVTARTDHGYGRTEGSVLVGLGQHVDGVVVKLFAARRIEGKVVIADGKAEKTACEEQWVSLRDPGNDRWVSAYSEPAGAIWAEGVLPGTYQVEVGCRGFQSKEKYEPLVVADKDLTGLVWEVEAGGAIRGRVLTKSGEPVEDAQIRARSTGPTARAKQGWGGDRSTKDGTYELLGLRTGSYKIDVGTPKGIGPKDGYKVDVAPGAIAQQDLVIEDAGTIKGTVADADGKPVAGVVVNATAMTNMRVRMMGMGQGEIKSDDTGAFVIEGLRAGDYRVLAQKSWNDRLKKPGTTDDAKQGEKVSVRAGQTATVRLVVESPTGIIKGTVVDATGAPVSDAWVSAARASDAAGALKSTVQQTRWSWDDKPVLTGVDGSFTLAKLAPGDYTVRAYRPGGGEAVADNVKTGATTKLTIKATGSIEGVVKRAGGGAPEELEVDVSDQTSGFSRDEGFYRTDGRFAIHDLPGGKLKLTATADGGKKQIEIELADGERKTGVVIELEALVTITGRVVEAGTQKPVPRIRMFAQPAEGGGGFRFNDSERENISDESGRFAIKNAPKGKLMLRGMPDMFGSESDYMFLQTVKTVEGTGTVDIGDVTILKKRVKDGETAGELGINFAQMPPGTSPDKRELKVSYIDPAGPAAKTDIKVGDLVTSIDGVDVTGANAVSYWMMVRAPPGTKLVLGLARGTSVTVILAAP